VLCCGTPSNRPTSQPANHGYKFKDIETPHESPPSSIIHKTTSVGIPSLQQLPIIHSSASFLYPQLQLHPTQLLTHLSSAPVQDTMASRNEDDLTPSKTEGFKVGEKKTLDEYAKLGMHVPDKE
jgi:hypothetical protein